MAQEPDATDAQKRKIFGWVPIMRKEDTDDTEENDD